ncbi:transcriptional enhancer factor TEF-3 isoform X2 [Pteropus alecto]|uniref:transcriptional enhancer factor TEF-3 isoform X2 n=1 Tax=Pteropus alecto TaxID=9402 RepID=UPI000D531338|nr:transcriptional enhancer factor TEF-3 isoform X2 [Pteropus alecto]
MMRRACGAQTLSRASRRPWPSTRPVAGARSFCQMRARCTSTSTVVKVQPKVYLTTQSELTPSPQRTACCPSVACAGAIVWVHVSPQLGGRNELIARYIKLRTGKTRTRKQVSSHIQVLARRKAREIQAKLKFWQGALPGQAGTSHDVKPFSQQSYTVQPSLPLPGFESPAGPAPSPSAPPAPPWQGRSVASSKLWMLEFSAFLEQQQDPDTYNKHLFVHIGQSSPSYSDPYLEAVDIRQIYDKFPEKKGGLKELFERGPSNAFFLVKFWADLNTNMEDEGSSFYGVSSQYESPENMIITCSTKVCSFGKQVVEKVETEYARYENGHYSYRIHRSPLCEYMINFIHKLKHLPEKYMMNSVLENFTILQVVTNRDTQETLLCIAYVFEVSASEHGAQHHIYRLVKD